MLKTFPVALSIEGKFGLFIDDTPYILTSNGIEETIGVKVNIPFIKTSPENLKPGDIVGMESDVDEKVGWVVKVNKSVIEILTEEKEIKTIACYSIDVVDNKAKVKLSIRSKENKAKEIAEKLGSGGHLNAAGAIIDVDELKILES